MSRTLLLISLFWMMRGMGEALAWQKEAEVAGRLQRGLELLRGNRLEEAKAELLEALRVAPKRADLNNTLGSICDRLGQTDEAIRYYREAIALEPGAAAIYNNLGIAHLRKGQSELAREAFHRAIKFDPGNVSGHYNLGIQYLHERRFREAVDHLQKARSHAPDDPGILFNLGTALLELEKPEACIALFESLPADAMVFQVPESPLLLGTALARVNRLDEAVVRLEEAGRMRPDAPEVHYRLGLVYQKKGEWSKARSYLEKASEMNPSTPFEYFLALGETYRNLGLIKEAVQTFARSLAIQDSVQARISLGTIYLEMRQYNEAIAEFEVAANKGTISTEAVLNLALALHRAGRNQAALDRLRSLESIPTFIKTRDYYQALSSVTASLGEWGWALEALKKASELEPRAVELYFQMGLLLVNAGAFEDATSLLSRVTEVFPVSASLQVGLAQVYIAGDRLDAAENHLRRAMQMSPDYDEPYYLLGNCFQDAGRFEEAVSFYQKAIERNSGRADFHFSLGLAHLRQGERSKALGDFSKALALESSAEALYRIASIHVERDSPSEAEGALKRALDLDPNHSQSHYLLFRVYSRRGEKSAAEREMRIFESLRKEEERNAGRTSKPDLKPVNYYLSALR